ncbi:transposase [Aeromicrobium sp. YIM 150415]|uniref:transposase n=1 Tax=Aeromicrobium sp. YIM 150415 TaxID=2803912 RepID=UPI001966B0D7|nr:transposase [Aeromicrobium sp. YIM 150415]MBM9463564.1 transposase [Aeromicrobium sp. YIM 150415]
MPAAKPPEFRRRALDLVEAGESVARVARNLGISESYLRRWMDQAAVDSGAKEGLTSVEKRELVELRRKNRVLEMENEILKHASAYFARENTLPKNGVPARPQACRRRVPRRGDLPGPGSLDV